MKNGKLRVALVGVSFGAEFIPIYLKHPDVDSLVLVDTNEKLLNMVGDKFLLEERLTDFNAMLEDKTIDEQWDAYVDQLNQMGLERLMEIYQEALDVYNNAA